MTLKINKDIRINQTHEHKEEPSHPHNHYTMDNKTGIREEECPVICLSNRCVHIVQCNGMKHDRVFQTLTDSIESDLKNSSDDERPVYPIVIYNRKYKDNIDNNGVLLPDLSIEYSKDMLPLLRQMIVGLQYLMDMTGYDGCLQLYTCGVPCGDILDLHHAAIKANAEEVTYLLGHLVLCGVARGAATYDRCVATTNTIALECDYKFGD